MVAFRGVAAAALVWCAGMARGGEAGLNLFVDAEDIASSRGVELRMHPPCRSERVFRFDAPWEGRESGYVTVLRDGPRWRLYYRGGGELTQEVTCVAESDDGATWTRPALGLFEFDGSRANNIVWRAPDRKSYGASHNFTPFIDTNPAAKPGERYKAVVLGWHTHPDGERRKAMDTMASPDGLRWHTLAGDAVTSGSFDSQNLAFWDAARGHYACYLRHGRGGFRSVAVTTSTDFLRWSAPRFLDFGDTPPEHLYTNAITPYFRDPSWLMGLPMRFVPGRRSVGDPPRPTDGVSDAVLVTSRDGLRFQRTFMEAFIRPGLNGHNWGHAHSNQTPAWGIHPASPTHMAVYWTDNVGDVPELRRGLLRVDGFASLHAGHGGGEAVTHPLEAVAGGRLVLNVSTSAVGSVRVELQGADGAPLPGHTLADCVEIWGDEIARVARWGEAATLPADASRVRLRIVLKDADLYSFRFEH